MYTFIIVDDEPVIRKGILKKIEALGLNVEFIGEADNGREALLLIQEKNPQIIVLDMRMPIMDGKALLKRLQKEHPDKKVIVASGYSDFEYMQEAISANVVTYLLKPFKREAIFDAFTKAIALIDKVELQQKKDVLVEVEKESNTLTEDLNTLCNFIMSQFVHNSHLNLKSQKLKSLHIKKSFILLCINSSIEFSKSNFEQLSFVSELSGDYVLIPNVSNLNMYFILFYGGGYTVTDEFPQKSRKTISVYQIAEKIANTLSKQIGNNIYIGLSEVFHSLNNLNEAYIKAISALNSMELFNDLHVFRLKEEEPIIKEIFWNRTDYLLFYIESGNTAKVIELTSLYFDFLSQQPYISIAAVKFNCHILFDQIRSLLKKYFDLSVSNTYSVSFEKIAENYFDLDSIKSYILQLLSNIANMLKQKNIYSSAEIVENIKKYVLKNYAQGLTLEKTADLFFINRSYCSTLFKEKTGENFSDFVSRVRIEKAKDLLVNTDYKIFKLAKSLGYDNTKYFFRIFKKLTGVTPDKYRQNMIKS